jgi:hypothetical protein
MMPQSSTERIAACEIPTSSFLDLHVICDFAFSWLVLTVYASNKSALYSTTFFFAFTFPPFALLM